MWGLGMSPAQPFGEYHFVIAPVDNPTKRATFAGPPNISTIALAGSMC